MLSRRSLFRNEPADEPKAEHPSQIGPHVLFDSATRDHDGFDIVFVHGLRGSSFGTWSKNGVCWPRDLLKEDTKDASLDARVITWGYDASIANLFTYASQESIFGHAERLLGDLARLRIGKNWPIIFLGHNLGGLVIKESLIKSAAYQSHGRHPTLGDIYVHTKGVIFLGTPHRGSNKESLGEVIAQVAKYSFRQPNDQLMRTLQHDSHILENQRDQFTTISKYIHVVCIREEIPTRFGMIVPEASASYDGFSVMRDSINANHMDMARFEHRQDMGYQRVWGHILRLIREKGPSKKEEVSQQVSHQRQPSSTVPFPRDKMFVGRENIMMAIEKLDQQRKKDFHERMALVGLGGVGKSQIAIEYTYRVREAAPNTSVFWIHASNATRFKQGYQEIASVAEIPDRDNPKIDILQLVNKWLSDEKNSQWLMVLDNADDNNVFFEPSGENMSLAHYLPQTANGSILITSRDKTAAYNLVGSDANMISVDPMSPGDALALLRTRINVDQSLENEAKALVKALEHIPLAITQAGAYIANRSPRITLSSYLDHFHRSESNQEHLLKYDDFKDLRRDESIRHPVITTWQISFDQIRHTSPMATDLLALMSMFDRQGIPENLINQNMNQLDFEDAVAPLISFSLIRAEIRGQSFKMHRLVQLSIRQWLKLHGQLDRWVKESRNVMEKAFPSGDYETWATCQMLFPHFKEMIKFILIADDADQVNEAAVAHRCGWYLLLTGSYDEAEGMHQRALIAREKVLGTEHPDTLVSVGDLGLALQRQGKYKEAEGMHRRALEGNKKALGAKHPDTLISVDNLASVLRSQGKYEEAEAIHQWTLK